MNKKIDEALTELLKDSELSDFEYEGFNTAEELIESLERQIDETECIYYSNAIKYLSENDASLNESISLACELGYELKNVNSELLATLLQQQNLREELEGLKDDIETIFNEADEEGA